MTREQLLHAIRAACGVLQTDEVLVLGSQAILGAFSESDLPQSATRSREADIAALSGDEEAASHLLTGVLGEDSGFDHINGFYVDGVSPTTALLPAGWRDRALRLRTHSVTQGRDVVGICPTAVDLRAAKLCAFREKDQEFVRGLVACELVASRDVLSALRTIPDVSPVVLDRAADFLRAL